MYPLFSGDRRTRTRPTRTQAGATTAGGRSHWRPSLFLQEDLCDFAPRGLRLRAGQLEVPRQPGTCGPVGAAGVGRSYSTAGVGLEATSAERSPTARIGEKVARVLTALPSAARRAVRRLRSGRRGWPSGARNRLPVLTRTAAAGPQTARARPNCPAGARRDAGRRRSRAHLRYPYDQRTAWPPARARSRNSSPRWRRYPRRPQGLYRSISCACCVPASLTDGNSPR